MNAEFQRIERRDKKAFLSEQSRETEETIEWERLELSSIKLDTKRTFHAKWLFEEALQIAEKRREEKDKGEKERYAHLNAEIQRTARRDKEAFLTYQCKEIEDNN